MIWENLAFLFTVIITHSIKNYRLMGTNLKIQKSMRNLGNNKITQ